ncbi:MAG: rhamnulokinase [Planctomycetota bacterium]|jgi:sugar (pentulose or hexulose) kinase|nr:rhamnulokinase [Planctomycetota bacterium]
MNKLKRYLALDFGAESGRAIAAHFDGHRIELEILHRFSTDSTNMLGTLFWDFPGFIRNVKLGLTAYSAKYGPELGGIACDSWGVDFGLLDNTGHLLGNPVHYRDKRTKGMTEKLHAIIPARTLYQRTGIQILEINTIYQLYYLVLSNSPLLDKAVSMLLLADLVSYMLTGIPVQEYTLATTSEMYDVKKGDWSSDSLLSAKIPPGIMPDIIAPGTVVGPILDSVAIECGLASTPIIAAGSHDTASAVAAVPAVGDDWLYISSGTWSLMGAELNSPIINDATFAKNFTNEGGVDGTIRFLKNITGMWILEECRRTWAKEGEKLDYATITRLGEQAAPLQRVINPTDIRYQAPGEMPSRINQALKESKQLPAREKGEFIRLILDSLALCYRYTGETLEELTGRKYNVIHIVGGGSQNTLLNQLTADATGKVVKAGPVEATALGNSLMQAMALGDIGSLAEGREVIRNSVEVTTYQPSGNSERWNDAYQRFLKLL